MVAKTNWKINTESNREYYFHLWIDFVHSVNNINWHINI
jgi:hypothetical protein